ncbi:hypothetical protein AUEXF2481DRAFT_3901 [Aureobasidium subglaciale EXF-2481]|uniref:Ribonuclease H2 subunit B n=1 Tax=Aureobasidium subglaciale (strain EXF-2481) TaxID=1043005 RepID=A0A074ZCG9_AURSE|nr:uncharacterized protein AUEXF2481DRAFT_3901 [Aureobasidium subglaciale EXF-2481]KAI5201203.1 hypothetical protein E4T38_06200 [Aureobasidium subglaciale]KAI5219899.1 hypothetical protein E4T40_06221 [Aureobasidium subglaciale]KAI5223683.1 hypothetical protein E4T41_05976 [Aureobasidium subglaciale]KAI5260561.1 hypothetical protein E4T46_05955 [Aureobasidium subglaciale]KEQ96396.1 hypothetical protein AUEXF2481DRAFT_3901 [Aureobasidium subglaciale EXF-2481]
MKTRATKSSIKATEATEETGFESSGLEASNNPPLLFVLPEGASPDARVVTLPNPATTAPSRYFFCPTKGIHEFTKVAVPKKTPRSWLITPEQSTTGGPDAGSIVDRGYTVENADLFVATPVDPLFVLLPALMPAADSHEQLFLTIDDHLDKLAEKAKHLTQLLRSTKIQQSFEKRADAVCDKVDLGHEKMFRLSNEKLLAELLKKASRMVANGLPASLESHFVEEALRIPMMAVQRTGSQGEETPSRDTDTATPSTATEQSQPSQTSAVTEATSLTSASDSTPDDITNLLRLRTALNLLFSTYIPSSLHTPLNTLLKSPTSPADFAPLDAHLGHIADAKRRAQALRSLSDNVSRKRSAYNDEEAEEREAAKKRKKEEEEAKKKNTSRAVKQLGKVNTTGMMKLSSFFTKAPAKK